MKKKIIVKEDKIKTNKLEYNKAKKWIERQKTRQGDKARHTHISNTEIHLKYKIRNYNI